MPKILSNLDLSKNELQNARVQNLGSHPSNAVEGQIYFNTAESKFYIYSNALWRDLVTSEEAMTNHGNEFHVEEYDTVISVNSKISGVQADLTNGLATKVDKVIGKVLSSNDYTDTEKTKLFGIDVGANNYSHPSTHPASIIDESITRRFVSDAEKTTWNNKSDLGLGETLTTAYRGDRGTTAYNHTLVSAGNPHSVTQTEVGLGSVENKSSATIRSEITSSNVTSALAFIPENAANKDQPNGYPSLDVNSKIPLAQLPDVSKQRTYVETSIVARDALTGLIEGDKCFVTDTKQSFIWDSIQWILLSDAHWENVNLDWANIINVPVEIVDAANKRHIHSNKAVIDLISTSGSGNIITPTERTKLNGIESSANNYIHPTSHAPSIISEDPNHRFVTDTEKNTWNAKSNLALGETFSTAYRGDRGKIAYDHSQSLHAPTDAQKNSDITKTEIEAKLTGEISTHTHNYPQKFTATIGDGINSAFTVNHNFGTRDVTVMVREAGIPYEQVFVDTEIVTINSVSFNFTEIPVLGQYRVIIIG